MCERDDSISLEGRNALLRETKQEVMVRKIYPTYNNNRPGKGQRPLMCTV